MNLSWSWSIVLKLLTAGGVPDALLFLYVLLRARPSGPPRMHGWISCLVNSNRVTCGFEVILEHLVEHYRRSDWPFPFVLFRAQPLGNPPEDMVESNAASRVYKSHTL